MECGEKQLAASLVRLLGNVPGSSYELAPSNAAQELQRASRQLWRPALSIEEASSSLVA